MTCPRPAPLTPPWAPTPRCCMPTPASRSASRHQTAPTSPGSTPAHLQGPSCALSTHPVTQWPVTTASLARPIAPAAPSACVCLKMGALTSSELLVVWRLSQSVNWFAKTQNPAPPTPGTIQPTPCRGAHASSFLSVPTKTQAVQSAPVASLIACHHVIYFLKC